MRTVLLPPLNLFGRKRMLKYSISLVKGVRFVQGLILKLYSNTFSNIYLMQL